MERLFTVILSVGMTFSLSMKALATPLYMTYTSEVTYEFNNSGYDYGINLGDILIHIYLIDKSEPGWHRLNGVKTYMPDKYYSDGSLKKDFFIANWCLAYCYQTLIMSLIH